MAKIPDPKEIQAQIDRLVNRTVDQQVEGKAAPAAPKAGAAKDPFAGMKKETPRAEAPTPTPPAAAAPSAPAAGGTSAPEAAPGQGYPLVDERGFVLEDSVTARRLLQSLLTIADSLGVPPDSAIKGTTEGATFKSGQQRIVAEWVVSGIQEVGKDPSAQTKWREADWQSILRSAGVNDGYGNNINEAVRYIQNSAPGTQGRPKNDFAPAGLSKVSAPAEAPVRRATSIGMAPEDVPVPPTGETTPSVAPTPLPEAPMPPAQTPETQVTATTPAKVAESDIAYLLEGRPETVEELLNRIEEKYKTKIIASLERTRAETGDAKSTNLSAKLKSQKQALYNKILGELSAAMAEFQKMSETSNIYNPFDDLEENWDIYLDSSDDNAVEEVLLDQQKIASNIKSELSSRLSSIADSIVNENPNLRGKGFFDDSQELIAPIVDEAQTQVTAPTPTDATVAQGTEQGTSKPLAAGSNPAGGATADWALLDITDQKLMGYKKGMLLDVDTSQNICIRTSDYWAAKMRENGFSNVRTAWVDATSPYLPESGIPYAIGHKVAIGEKDGKTFILDLPQTEFITMGEADYERSESFMNNAESEIFRKFKSDDEMSDWIEKKYGEDALIDTRGGDQHMVAAFLKKKGENLVFDKKRGTYEGTYKGIPFKYNGSELLIKPKQSLRVTQDQLVPRLMEIDPSKDLTQEYAEKFALPEETVTPKNPNLLPSEPEVKQTTAAKSAKDAFGKMKATPEQIKATAAPADGDFGIEGDIPEYTLPETDGRYVGIIGTAGRREDGARLTEGDYRYLVGYIGKAVKPNDVLISGGAAWADHVAVQLFLDGKVGGLVLHLPAELIVGPDGKLTFRNGGFGTAGNTANYYHSLFDKALRVESGSSLKQIQEAIDRGAVVTFGDGTQGNEGMKARNSLVARDARDVLVAMTFDPNMETQTPKDGGTADTWRKHRKGHPEAKRTLVDIRAKNPDPSEAERLRAFRSKKGQYALSQVETEQTADMLNAMAKAEGEKGSLLDKAAQNIRDLAMTESAAQGYNLQQALQAMQAEEAKILTRAGRIAFLPTDKLVSAALVIAMLDAQAPVSDEILAMIDEGFLPNVGMLKKKQDTEIDVQAAIRFMRDRILTKTIELGKGENDVLITRILENAGVPKSAFAKTGADAPAYTYPGADAQAAEVKIKRVNNDLKRVLARIQKNAADLGPLMSHPEVAKRLYFVTSLLSGIEQDIDSEFAGEALPSRLRTDKYSGLPYLRALEQIDPIFEYIRMRADIDPAQVLPEDPGDRDPYKIADAVLAAGAQPPQSRGKRGRYVYDEAQLHATYKSGTPYRRYAFDINGEVHPQYMTLDELGLVTDKFDGFENPYAGLASSNEGGAGRSNTSRATIGMHISTDSSARVEWVSRIPNKEVEVLRAIKKLLADKHPAYITPGTPDEIAIVPGAFTNYTRDAALVDSAADAVYNDVSNAMGKVYLVDVTGSRQSQVTIDGVTYFIGKGMYAFKDGDDTGVKLAQEVSALEDDAGPSSRVSKPFKLGDRAEYPAITGELKYFRIDIDPVVHMTFAHNDQTLLSQRDAARFGESFDPDQQITTPLKPARGGKFQGMYLLSSEYTKEPGFTYRMVEEPYNLELKNEDGTPMLNAETGKPVTVRMFRTVAVGERASMAPGVADFADYTDNSPTNIEFDEGLRFVIGNDIQLGRTLDGVDLIEDNYDDVVAMEIRQQQPVFLQGAERRARDRQERIEQGLDPVDETMSESDKAYRNFTEAGERVDHFGREYSFADHGEYDTDSPFDPSVAKRRSTDRMQALAPGAGGETLAEADVKALPQFTMEDFMRPEALTPDSQKILDQLVADYFYILRVRARDVSQMVPNPKLVEREGQIGWRALRGVVKLRGEMLRDLGYRRALALHRYQTREPAILNAVLFDIFAATGDRVDVANEVTKQVYTDIEVEDNFVSTRKGKPSFRDTPIVDDADALAREFAFSVARRMLRERTPNVYETSTESIVAREASADERAMEAERGGGSAEAVTDYKSELAQIAEQSNMSEGQTRPYTGFEIGESLQHILEDGRTISASSPEGKEWVQAIMERERQGKIPEKVLTNMINALETAEEEAAIKALRSKIKAKEAPAPQTIEAPVAKKPAPRVNRVLDPMSVDERRAFANRAWALYSEHVAADGDGDAFVKTINRALSAATTVKGKENKFNQILNFVFDNNGTVMIPDVYFTDVNGNKTYPEPKVKNPQYNSAARRGSAFDATFTVEEMEKFVTEMSTMRTSKLAGGLRQIIRYVKAQNKSAGKKKQLRFYVTIDRETGMPKFSLSVSPTRPGQKYVATPFAPGGVDREGRVKAGGEAFDEPFATMQGDANRLQSLTADDMEAVLRSAGADSAIKVVRKESEILRQAEGVASAEDFARAQPYDLVFTEGFDADEISGSLFDELPDHVKGDDRSKVMKIILDAAVRARFFQIMKTDLDQQGIDSSFITEDDLDPSAFKKVETPEGSKYALKPRLEQDGTFAGPFSRRGKGPVRTLKLRDIEGDDRTSRALKAVLERIKQGGTYAEQLDMDEAARQAANVLEFRNKALGLDRTSAPEAPREPIDIIATNQRQSNKLPRFTPGAKAGIAGGTIAGTLAAYLQFGADEEAKQMALASLPSQVGFEALGAIPKVGGPVAAATGLGLTYATGGDMLRALAGITGSVVGGIAGTGAGLFTGPGAFVSGLAGSTAGYMIADNLYSAVTGKSPASQVPNNVARSNSLMEQRTRTPSVRDAMPIVNRDIAELERMGG